MQRRPAVQCNRELPHATLPRRRVQVGLGQSNSGIVVPGQTGHQPDPQAEDIWLKTILDPQVQREFNLAKGSAPVRTDVPLDGFPPYQKAAAEDLRTLKIVSSVAHHQGASAEFSQTYLDAVTAINGDKNVDAFLKKMTTAQKDLAG
jgi:glucose/mannose transport system substrate-binding protein